MKMSTIESLMVTEMISAAPDESVLKVADRMVRNRIGAVLVLDGARLAGIFSERDLLTRVIGEGRDLSTTHVGEVATRDVVTIDVEQPVRSVVEIFRACRFRHLPVVRAGRAVGILSTRDFLAFVVDGLESYVEKARYDRELAAGIDPYDHMGGSYAR
jgi:CBS domain-containing protein